MACDIKDYDEYKEVGVSNPCDGHGSVTHDASSQSVMNLACKSVCSLNITELVAQNTSIIYWYMIYSAMSIELSN